jgi:hypothetical protein
VNTTTRALAIIRISQRDEDAHSDEVQIRAAYRTAADHGLTLEPEDILNENLGDDGKIRKTASGGWGLDRRPKLLYALEEVEAGRAAAIIGERADRLFRDLDLQSQVIRRVEAANGKLLASNGALSHATAEAELQAVINGGVNQYVKRTAKERSWAAVEVAIEEGRIPWSQTAPGYTRDEDSRLHPDRTVKPVIVKAFKKRQGGATIEEVQAFLRAHGIERSYHGTQWLLRDRIYLGEIHFGKHTPNLKAHTAIIDRTLFDEVQKIRKPRGRKPKSERLLARLGVLRCGNYSAKMVVATSHKSRYWVYRCPPQGDCPQHQSIGAEIAETFVTEQVKLLHDAAKESASPEDDLTIAYGEWQAAEKALATQMRILAGAGVEHEPSAIEILTALREDRDAKKSTYEGMANRREAQSVVLTLADFDECSLEGKRALIKALVPPLYVTPGRGKARLTFERPPALDNLSLSHV